MIKYSFDDLKKFQFEGKLSLDTKKILFKNNIWNPDHPRQIPTFNRSQNSFVEPINRNIINRNSINRNSFGRNSIDKSSINRNIINKNNLIKN